MLIDELFLYDNDNIANSILKNCHQAFLLKEFNGKIIYANKDAELMFDYNLVEFKQLTRENIIVHEDEQLQKLLYLRNINKRIKGEAIAIKKNGDKFPIEFSSVIHETKDNKKIVSYFITDISEKKKSADLLKQSEELFKSIVENSSDIITLLDATGKILYQSTSVQQHMGYEKNELAGKHFHEFIHPDDLPKVLTEFTKMATNELLFNSMEFRLLNKNGEYLTLHASANNQLNNPSVKAIIINSRDISEKKKIEFEKEKLIEELLRYNYELKQFSYIVSHNLRAPLTNLLSISSLLEDEVVDKITHQNLIKGLKTVSKDLTDTVNDLSEILFIKDFKSSQREALQFEKIYKKSLNKLSAITGFTNTIFKIDFSQAPVVKFIEPYLENVFFQLLSNAIKYAHANRQLLIEIETMEQANNILLRVKDNGKGMDVNKVKDKIFGLYQRFHTNESKGLGLYLIKAQLAAYNATIHFESTVDVGTVFTITFPK